MKIAPMILGSVAAAIPSSQNSVQITQNQQNFEIFTTLKTKISTFETIYNRIKESQKQFSKDAKLTLARLKKHNENIVKEVNELIANNKLETLDKATANKYLYETEKLIIHAKNISFNARINILSKDYGEYIVAQATFRAELPRFKATVAKIQKHKNKVGFNQNDLDELKFPLGRFEQYETTNFPEVDELEKLIAPNKFLWPNQHAINGLNNLRNQQAAANFIFNKIDTTKVKKVKEAKSTAEIQSKPYTPPTKKVAKLIPPVLNNDEGNFGYRYGDHPDQSDLTPPAQEGYQFEFKSSKKISANTFKVVYTSQKEDNERPGWLIQKDHEFTLVGPSGTPKPTTKSEVAINLEQNEEVHQEALKGATAMTPDQGPTQIPHDQQSTETGIYSKLQGRAKDLKLVYDKIKSYVSEPTDNLTPADKLLLKQIQVFNDTEIKKIASIENDKEAMFIMLYNTEKMIVKAKDIAFKVGAWNYGYTNAQATFRTELTKFEATVAKIEKHKNKQGFSQRALDSLKIQVQMFGNYKTQDFIELTQDQVEASSHIHYSNEEAINYLRGLREQQAYANFILNKIGKSSEVEAVSIKPALKTSTKVGELEQNKDVCQESTTMEQAFLQKIEKLKMQIQNLESQVKQYRVTAEKEKQERAKLDKENQELKAENQNLKFENQKLKDENAVLNRKLYRKSMAAWKFWKQWKKWEKEAKAWKEKVQKFEYWFERRSHYSSYSLRRIYAHKFDNSKTG